MDTLTERITYPCEPATDKELMNAAFGASIGFLSDCQKLSRMLAPVPEDRIPWNALNALCILGTAHKNSMDELRKASLEPGSYVSHDGGWLFQILPEDYLIQPLLERCGDRLQTLLLHNTHLPELDFSSLSSLRALDLYFNQDLRRIPGLDALTGLTRLILSDCENLTQLPPLDALTNLTSLSLTACKNLTQLPPLDALTGLTSLYLSGCENLTQLPPLDALTGLTRLTLSGCENLTQLPPLDALTGLTSLNLYKCSGIRMLPEELRNMKSLRKLDLSFLHLENLPDWLPDIAESFSLEPFFDHGKEKAAVCLWHTTVDTIPDAESFFYQPYEVICQWFEARRLGRSRPLNEIKVVFLGDGEAGKSHTIARLMNDGGDPVDYTDKSTPGIVIKHKDYEQDDRKFRVHYWDFGGQEIMHSMHRIFLTSRTMYVVLLNARDDTQGDRAHYWLHNIQSFAPGAPVLLVLNKIDQNPKASVDERTLRSRYPGLTQVVKLSALDFSREEFNLALRDVLLAEICKTNVLDQQWPQSWIQVKKRLETMDTHYIWGSDYKRICKECQVEGVQTELLHWFNDLGVSFCFCDEEDYTLNNHVILRPDWITNGLYIILFNDCIGARNGRIPHKSIYALLARAGEDETIRCTLPDARYDRPGDVSYVLDVMRKFQLSLDNQDGHEFIPMLCNQASTVDIHYYERDPEVLEFTMQFDYLPDNLLHRLMVERHDELDMDNVWRTGARFQHKELGFSAVVVIDGNALRFFIRHDNPMHRPNTYLTMLKANVDRIWKKMGLKAPICYLIYKVDSKRATFRYDRLVKMYSRGKTEEYCEELDTDFPIEDILNQSAPDGLQNEMLLLTAIREACGRIQDEPIYRLIKNENGKGFKNGKGMEDLRNRRIRDDLLLLLTNQYRVCDQTQIGSSGSGKSVGELDLLIRRENNEHWTIIEALRVGDGTKQSWDDHLDKLLVNYNSRGLPLLYLLTYVDAEPKTFCDICTSYETYIPGHTSGPYSCVENSFQPLDCNNSQSFRAAKCRYTCGGVPITVYHIFARISTQGE